MDSSDAGLFDGDGRRIPAGLESAAHRETRRRFVCAQPQIDYARMHDRLTRHLGADGAPSAAEFEARAEAILVGVGGDPRTAGMLAGARVPFLLPRAACADIGRELEDRYLPAVARSFLECFPERAFTNYCAGALAGKIQPAQRSRHERILQAMRQRAVVGYYFPCLLEFSVPAAIEQLHSLPESFLLAGGFDTCAAFVGSPELLLRHEGYPPLLWMAGLAGENERVGYHFEAYGYNLTFNRRPHFGRAAEYWASALVVTD